MAKKSRRRSSGRGLKILVLLIVLLATALYYHKEVIRYSYKVYRVYKRIAHPVKPGSGIIEYPLGYSVHGIDVSRWQDEIDWSRIGSRTREGDTLRYHFAFIKATQGTWMEDPMFADNWKQAAKNKIIRGAYHYFVPGSDAVKQARNFISSVDLRQGDLPPVVDIEETRGKSRKYIVAQLRVFLKIIEDHYKTEPIIYSNISFIENYLAADFEDYNFWVAHYYREELLVDDNIKWLFWQHSDRAGLIGCDYLVDVNVFNGTPRQLQKILVR